MEYKTPSSANEDNKTGKQLSAKPQRKGGSKGVHKPPWGVSSQTPPKHKGSEKATTGSGTAVGVIAALATTANQADTPPDPKQVQALQQLIDDAQKLQAEANKLDKAGKKADAAKKRAAVAKMRNEAIKKAVNLYKINDSNVKKLVYDATVSDVANTSKSGNVKVGDAAFKSAGWLGSSLGHEIEVHINQQAKKGNWYTGAIGTALQEVEAYDYEIKNAKRYGTTKKDLRSLKRARKVYYKQLPKEYKKRVSKGNYTMKTGEEYN